ncbi:hypothetical protein ACMU_10015 [Actibacterium mucosum KCTC 23349]|uniref:HTH marR-type domain-containing protein n=2 Tax=Actibacterium TaxID=1433986 RepID=A0A037ZKB9_9RHOB|nr:hypothetical protein ACMU_10015 [Actibacterium mucosum KCTC 23349]
MLHLERFLPYRLNRVAEAVSDEIRPIYKGLHGMNRPEWRVLVALAHIGPATATALCRHSAQHKTKVSRAVVALEKRRWITRDNDPADRRSEILQLNAAGHAAYRQIAGPVADADAAIQAKLAPGDRAALEQGLAALERAMGLVD